MLQRIQTVYLILAVIVTGVLPYFFPLWKENSGTEIVDFYFMKEISYVALFGLSTTLSIISIISFSTLA